MPPAPLLVDAPAKINLYLGVHPAPDAAGYHRVDSVMVALSLADTLEIAPAEQLTVTLDPPADFPQERNTAYRALAALACAFDREPALAVRIRKRIPICAGLGGPSTDAAAALRGACRLWGIAPRDPWVLEVARSIGADVPFFLYDAPAYLAGRGDTLQELLPALDGVSVALVKPQGAGVATGEAYAHFDADPQPLPPLAPLLAALREGRLADALPYVANNLAPAACALAPEIAEVVAWLRAQPGVQAAEVSGSGACSFALCAWHEDAEAIAAAAQTRGWWAYAARMEKSGPFSRGD